MVYPLKKGVAGAAIATGAANLLGFLVVLSHYILKKGRLRFRRFRPQLSLYRKIILRGAPEMISQFANQIITLSMNNMLITHLGNTAVNAYSVITYASSLFSSLIWGLASGLQPLYGASYGAKDDKSLRYYFRSGRIIAFVGGVTIFHDLLCRRTALPVLRRGGGDPDRLRLSSEILPELCFRRVDRCHRVLPVLHKVDAVRDHNQRVQKHRIQLHLHQLPAAHLRI